MRKVIVDSNIIIDHARGKNRLFTELLRLQMVGKIQLLIPTAVVMELFSGKETKSQKNEQSLEQLLKLCLFTDLTYEIAKRAGFLARDFTQIPDAIDFIICASAQELDAEVATRNTKHFKAFPQLKIFKE